MLKDALPKKCGCVCEAPDLVLDGCVPRKIRTRLGVIDLPRITRERCKRCGKIARIVLKLFAAEGEWKDYWRKRMDLNRSVMLSFKVLEVR